MKKYAALLLFLCVSAMSADNLISDGKSGNWQIIDNNNNRWNAHVAYTTDGNGDVITLGGLSCSNDDTIGDFLSGNHQLIDNNGKRWGLSVWYTTDGHGNVIPIPGTSASVSSVFGRTGAVTALSGDYSAYYDALGAAAIAQSSAEAASDPLGSASTVQGLSLQKTSNLSDVASASTALANIGGQHAGNYITALTSDVVASGPGSATATIQPNAVTNSKLAQMPASTFKGNNTGSTANASDLTATQATAMLNPVVGDSGSGGTQGVVPAPNSGQSEAGAYLSAGGSFTSPDQSKPLYDRFSLLSQTLPNMATPGTSLMKFLNVVISGTHAYVVGGGNPGNTLSIYNIANQSNPVPEGYIPTASVGWTSGPSYLNGAYNLAVNGSYAYICSSGSSRVYAVNVSNPNAPFNVSGLTVSRSPGSLYGCAYQNGLVYIATQSAGLTVVDFGASSGGCGGTLTTPVQCYQEGGGVKSFGVAVSGNNLYTTQYVTSGFTTRQVKSWTLTGAGTPSVPSLVQSLQVTTAGEPLGISLNGNTAYVGVTTSGVNAIDVIDITTPSAMTNVSQITPTYTLSSAMNAVPHGSFLYVPSGANATNGGAIDLYDMTNRASPIKVSTTYVGPAASPFGALAIDGKGYIYAADYGVAPGYYSTLDVLSEPNFVATIGSATIESLTTTPQPSGAAPTCGAAQSGLVKMTSTGLLCSCISSAWVNVGTGVTCVF